MSKPDDGMDADSQFAPVGGLSVHYKRAGRGPTLLMLHGSGSSYHCFADVAARLASSFDVVRPDLPGFGLTGPRADRDYTIQAYARTVGRLMDVLGLSRCVLAGNSLGGEIAWNFALDAPSRVTALVLINATGYRDKTEPPAWRLARNPWLRPLLRRWLPRSSAERSLRAVVGDTSIVSPAMVDRVHKLMSRPGNRGALIDYINTEQLDRSAQIATIVAPTLVLRSESVDGQHFLRDIANCQERAHVTAGHLLPEEDPAWVATAISQFLRPDIGSQS